MFSKFTKAATKIAAATADVATKAATATATYANEQYTVLSSKPTKIKCATEECVNNKVVIDVPASVWFWKCPADGCAGDSNESEAKECSTCQQPKPKLPPTVVKCATCSADNVVYATNAAQNAADAARATKKGAKDLSNWTQAKFVELKSRPTVVQCRSDSCKLLLSVPLEVWDWECESNHANAAASKKCAFDGCEHSRPTFTPVLTCQCGEQVMVPSTAAKAQLDQGLTSAKEQGQKAAVAAKASYSHWTSAPEQFNCQHCNEKLHVPAPAFWACSNCGVQNSPDITKCSGCATKNRQEVLCGNCNQVCTVPDSNLANTARTTKLSAKKSAISLKAGVKKMTADSNDNSNKEENKAA